MHPSKWLQRNLQAFLKQNFFICRQLRILFPMTHHHHHQSSSRWTWINRLPSFSSSIFSRRESLDKWCTFSTDQTPFLFHPTDSTENTTHCAPPRPVSTFLHPSPDSSWTDCCSISTGLPLSFPTADCAKALSQQDSHNIINLIYY